MSHRDLCLSVARAQHTQYHPSLCIFHFRVSRLVYASHRRFAARVNCFVFVSSTSSSSSFFSLLLWHFFYVCLFVDLFVCVYCVYICFCFSERTFLDWFHLFSNDDNDDFCFALSTMLAMTENCVPNTKSTRICIDGSHWYLFSFVLWCWWWARWSDVEETADWL